MLYYKWAGRKEVLQQTNQPSQWWGYVEEIKESTAKAPSGQLWNDLSNKRSEVGLDYNPKYKIYYFILM